jgi:hypothetical protein
VVVADGSEKNPHCSKYQALADQLRGQPHVKKNFSIPATNNLAGILESEPVMESVLLLPSHTNSDLRYCAEEIMQGVDKFLCTSEQHSIIPFFAFVLDTSKLKYWTLLSMMKKQNVGNNTLDVQKRG